MFRTEDDWRSAIAEYLAGKSQAFAATVAREALGFSYRDMTVERWRRLAGTMKGLGWRSRKQVWTPAEPQPQFI
jgi:hypothetical protein